MIHLRLLRLRFFGCFWAAWGEQAGKWLRVGLAFHQQAPSRRRECHFYCALYQGRSTMPRSAYDAMPFEVGKMLFPVWHSRLLALLPLTP